MSPDAHSLPPSPAWLAGAAAVSVAAFLAAAAALVLRHRRGLPLVAPRPHRDVPWRGSDVLVVVIAGLLAASFVGAGIGREPPLDVRLSGSLLLTSVAAILAIGWLTARGATAGDLGFVEGRLAEDVRLAATALALVLAPVLALAAVLNHLVPYEHDVVALLASRRDPWAVTLVVVTAVGAAPLVEELFFRRILQGWLEKRLPDRDGAAAIALSAAAFALAHQGQGLAFVPLFPLGLVLGFVARRTGSIVPCILLHALFNAVSVALLLATPPPLPEAPAP